MQLIFVVINLLSLVQSGVLSTSYPKTDCSKIGTYERIWTIEYDDEYEYDLPTHIIFECICKV